MDSQETGPSVGRVDSAHFRGARGQGEPAEVGVPHNLPHAISHSLQTDVHTE